MFLILNILNSALVITANILFVLFGYKNLNEIKYSKLFFFIGIVNISSILFPLVFSVYIQISDVSLMFQLFSIYLRVLFFLSFVIMFLTFGICFIIIGFKNIARFGMYLLVSGIVISFSYIFLIFESIILKISILTTDFYLFGGYFLLVNELIAFIFVFAQGIKIKEKLFEINGVLLILVVITTFMLLGSLNTPLN